MKNTTNPEAITSAVLTSNFSELLAYGVDRRNSGDYNTAAIALHACIALRPEHWQPLYEVAILYRERSSITDAIPYFRKSLAAGAPFAALEALVSALLANDSPTEAMDAIRRYSHRDFKELRSARILAQYIEFRIAFPLEVMNACFQPVARRLLSDSETKNQIRELKLDRRPYAFVRLGDGEGTWLQHDIAEELQFGDLYQRNRNEFWNVWYGLEDNDRQDQFLHSTRSIAAELPAADLVGVPMMSWVEHERSILSLRGYPGTVNAVRLAAAMSSETVRFAPTNIHYLLDRHGTLKELLQDEHRVGVISCHPGIVDFIKSSFGVDDVLFMGIPGEPSRRHLHGDGTISGDHYPGRYHEIMSEISRSDYAKTIFLVGGGVLGKHYTMALKKAGAVALDIGSVADNWMGKKTRPQFA